jgi:hypothetical protein
MCYHKYAGLSLEPMIGAIAAGNTMVLKPSELAPASASLLANVLPTYLDNSAVKVIQGGPAVGERLLQQKWDKIFFTGVHTVITRTHIYKHMNEHTCRVNVNVCIKCHVCLYTIRKLMTSFSFLLKWTNITYMVMFH